jgi:hypothetical protein
MRPIHQLITQLRNRPDVSVLDQQESWLIGITKGPDLVCEVTIPHDVLEWFASVRHRREKREVWADSMDYTGYDESTRERIEADMARDILAFVDRVSIKHPLLPLQIYEDCP